MLSNKVAGHNLEDWVLAWPSAKHLWEAHKGTITAQKRRRNKGSTFTLVFPTSEKGRLKLRAFRPNCLKHQAMRFACRNHEDSNDRYELASTRGITCSQR